MTPLLPLKPPVLHRATVNPRGDDTGLTVFFELPAERMLRVTPAAWLRVVLMGLWGVGQYDMDIHDVQCEQELVGTQAVDRHAVPDVRLFAVGYWHGPIYADPDTTLMLVRPDTLARLRAAQHALPIIDATAAMPAPL